MDKKGEWRLAPAYDLCYSYRPGRLWVSQQSLSVNGKRQNISRNDFLTVAKQMNVKKGEKIINQTNEVIQSWNHYAALTNVSPELAGAIQKNLLKI